MPSAAAATALRCARRKLSQELRATRDLARQQVRLEVQQALETLEVADASLETALKRTEAAGGAFRIASRKRDLGQINQAEFIDARRAQTEALLNLNRVRAEFLGRLAELEYGVGDPARRRQGGPSMRLYSLAVIAVASALLVALCLQGISSDAAIALQWQQGTADTVAALQEAGREALARNDLPAIVRKSVRFLGWPSADTLPRASVMLVVAWIEGLSPRGEVNATACRRASPR